MPTSPGNEIRVEGLASLRRSIRAYDRGVLKEVQAVTKHAAMIVAVEARTLAPRQSGALAASIKPGTSGSAGIVRSPLPYASVVHYGGTISPRGTPITFQRSNFVGRALDNKRGEVIADLSRGFNELAVRNGFT